MTCIAATQLVNDGQLDLREAWQTGGDGAI
jgi:hypothetical protein